MLYRKKPVVVEVVKFDKEVWEASIREDKIGSVFPMVVLDISGGWRPVIETLEGNMVVSDGDYIIKGVQGEYCPCKPDIFHETYDKVKIEEEEQC